MRVVLGALLACGIALAMHGSARAQSLADAESELAAGNGVHARAIATALVDQGTHVGTELAPMYRVIGLAAATAGDEDAAREAFTRWLALDPEGHLDRTLPDDVRSPFLEARGFWASQPTRLGATATLREGGAGVEVAIVDPASMVARLRVRLRRDGGAWSDVVRAPTATVSIDVPGLGSGRIDYVITFLDESGNRIWTRGTDDAPLTLGESTTSDAVMPPPDSSVPHAPVADATGFHIGAVIAGVIAVGAIVGAAVFHADRERLAGIYNGDDGTGCTGMGSTRGEVCAPQHSAIATDEIAAGVLYAVGGAAAITAIVLAAIAPSGSSADTAFACGAGPGTFGIACGGTF